MAEPFGQTEKESKLGYYYTLAKYILWYMSHVTGTRFSCRGHRTTLKYRLSADGAEDPGLRLTKNE